MASLSSPSRSSPSISIVFHSGYGHTQRIAQAIAETSGGTLLALSDQGELPDHGWAQLDASRAIVFGSPTYMANVSWQFKRFADASSAVWARQGWKDKLAAGFTNSAGMNGDKLTTLYTLFSLSQQHGMLWAGTALAPSNTKAADRNDINYVASFAGLMATTPADAAPDEMAPGDIATAKLFGERIAAMVRRLG